MCACAHCPNFVHELQSFISVHSIYFTVWCTYSSFPFLIWWQIFPGLILSDIKPAKKMKFKTVCYLLVQLMHCRKMFKAEIPFSNVMNCEDGDKVLSLVCVRWRFCVCLRCDFANETLQLEFPGKSIVSCMIYCLLPPLVSLPETNITFTPTKPCSASGTGNLPKS